MNPKSLFASKTFWLNTAMIGTQVASGSLGFEIPPKVAVPLLAASNIVLRLLTKQPVTVSF